MHKAQLIFATAFAVMLSACEAAPSSNEEPALPAEPTAQEGGDPETVSIFRPDVEAELEQSGSTALEALELTIGFPDGGSDLSEEAVEQLQSVLESPQFQQGFPVTLAAHSDSAGSDAVNARAAEARGLAVAEWLIEQGVDPARINVVVFGEQNPVQPNALPDGSPNEEGRAANRRVDVQLLAPVEGSPESTTSQSGD